MKRPAFTRLLGHVRTGEVQQIAVWTGDPVPYGLDVICMSGDKIKWRVATRRVHNETTARQTA